MFLQNEPEVMVGSLLALIYTHRKCVTIDKEAVTNFDIKLKEERKKIWGNWFRYELKTQNQLK